MSKCDPSVKQGGDMTTSRTGTATWKRVRLQALARAKRNGVTHCPHCNVKLDYEQSRIPASAEPDHITPWAMGGKDHVDNIIVICRQCNQSKGHRDAPKAVPQPIKTSRRW